MKRVIKRDSNERGKNREFAKIEFLDSWNLYYTKKHREVKNEFKYSKKTDIDILIKKILNFKI